MVSSQVFRELALSLPGVVELPHFEKASFRINSKIFAALDEAKQQASVRLSPADQNVFSVFDKEIIYPISNKWGIRGWTIIELKKIKKAMLRDILQLAYDDRMQKK